MAVAGVIAKPAMAQKGSPGWMRQFCLVANEDGIRVQAMTGSPPSR